MFSNDLDSRQQLDRRRLEEAFMQYALLRVASWYQSSINIERLYLHDGLNQTLLNTTPLFHNAFIQRYASKSVNCMILLSTVCHYHNGILLSLTLCAYAVVVLCVCVCVYVCLYVTALYGRMLIIAVPTESA